MKTIFDSTKGLIVANRYDDDYFVSSPFVVRAGQTAHLMLTAPATRYRDVSFMVLRFPTPLKQSDIASCLKGVYSRLVRGFADVPAPYPQDPKQLPNHNVVTLGQVYMNNDNTRHQDVYDYITIQRPGNYLLYGSRLHNPLIDTPDHLPVIIEVDITA